MKRGFGVSNFIMDSGERYSLVVDRSTGLPLYYPNLYLTTQLRNRSVAHATMEAEANHLVVLFRYLELRGIDLHERFLRKKFLESFELDDLRDYLQLKQRGVHRGEKADTVINLITTSASDNIVSNKTQYVRLSAVANYLDWYLKTILDKADQNVMDRIVEIGQGIITRRPKKKGRNNNNLNRDLTDDQLGILFESIRPGSEFNPFTELVQKRNRLIVLLLFHLGIRGGELLNIRIRDINFNSNRIAIPRRSDEKDDPRVNEPNSKTLGRLIPLGDALAKELHDYIIHDRRKLAKARSHDFLIVTHKAGETEGSPLEKHSYYKVINVIRSLSPELMSLSGHKLRHTWNRRFSEMMDSMDEPPGEVRQEQMRSALMGWKEGSGTAATYNTRFTEKKAHQASLEMQQSSGIRMPKRMPE